MAQAVFNTSKFQKLQNDILQLQGMRTALDSGQPQIGLGIINEAFPNKAFPIGAVHEFISQSKQDAAATIGFITGVLKTLMNKGTCLWVSNGCRVFPPALKTFGITPDQVIFVHPLTNKDALWVIEEGLKCETLAAVVGEVKDLSFTESRRLQLAVEKSHVSGFIHRTGNYSPGTVACIARWIVRPLLSTTIEDGMPGVGLPTWNVELSKVRNGKPGSWQVQWANCGFYVIEGVTSALPQLIKKAV